MFGSANKSGLTLGTPQSTALFPSAAGTGGTGFGTFGASTGTAFGTPAATGTAFGTPAPTGVSTPFGASFGQTPAVAGATQTTGAGGLFGQTPAAGTTPATGGLFGQVPALGSAMAAAQPTTGMGLFGQANIGQPSTTGFFSQPTAGQPTATGGLFGQQMTGAVQPSTGGGAGGLFGQQITGAVQPSTGGGLFGQSTMTGQAGTGGGLFGSKPFGSSAVPTTSTAFSGLGFGATQPTTVPASGGFGSTLFGGFGQTSAASTVPGASGLGLFNASSQNRGLMGTTTTTATPGFAGTVFGNLSQQPQQPQPMMQSAPAINEMQQLQVALNQPAVFGDERDATLAKWNQLQASWGTGKAFFLLSAPPVDLKRQNPYCCFKAVGYSRMPSTKNEDGLVALITSKSEKELLDNQQSSVNFLTQLLGNDASLSVCVESVRGLPDGKSELTFYVIQRPPSGSARRIESFELCRVLTQPNIYAALSQGGVESVIPKVTLAADTLDVYLRTAPVGIDPRLWEQAKKDNPDPKNMLPVPMVGFGELRRRLKLQEQQSSLHRSRLDIIQSDIVQLQLAQAKTTSRIEEYKRKHLELSHRVLKIMAKQEVHRRIGFGITADEEQLRARLESLQYDLTAPAQFRGRLQELLSQIHMQSHLVSARPDSYRLDSSLQVEIKQLLKEQQAGLQHLVQIVKADLEDMSLLEASLRNATIKPGASGES